MIVPFSGHVYFFILWHDEKLVTLTQFHGDFCTSAVKNAKNLIVFDASD